MSEGKISGVNWIRLKESPRDLAIAYAIVVLPIPGTSSIKTCPDEASAITISFDGISLPTIILDIFPTIFFITLFLCSFIKHLVISFNFILTVYV